MQACKQKSQRRIEKRKGRVQLVDVESTDEGENGDQEERHLNFDTGIDLEAENWAMSPEEETFGHEKDKSKNHTKDYSSC